MKKERITTFTNKKPKWTIKIVILIIVLLILIAAIKPIRKTVNLIGDTVDTKVSIIYEMLKAERLIKYALFSDGDSYIINLTYKTRIEREELCNEMMKQGYEYSIIESDENPIQYYYVFSKLKKKRID